MKILVVDVAAESGGALTVLNQFIDEYSLNLNHEYVFILSRPHYEDKDNIHFVNIEWVKKSLLHRLYLSVSKVFSIESRYNFCSTYLSFIFKVLVFFTLTL